MLAPLNPVRDLRLSGQVIYTGRSSMEIAVKMEAMNSGGTEETIMLGEKSFSTYFFLGLNDLDQVGSPWFVEMQIPIAHGRSTHLLSLHRKRKLFLPLERVCSHSRTTRIRSDGSLRLKAAKTKPCSSFTNSRSPYLSRSARFAHILSELWSGGR